MAVADLIFSFAVGDDSRAVDEAFLYESGNKAPLITYGHLRALMTAYQDMLPRNFTEMVEGARNQIRAAGLHPPKPSAKAAPAAGMTETQSANCRGPEC